MLKFSAVILFFVFTGVCFGQQPSTPVRMSDPRGSGTTDATSPCIRVLPTGEVYATWFSGTVSIHFSRSLDGGKTFLPSVIASTAITSNSFDNQFQRSPEFAVDKKGVIHIVWTEDRINAQNDVWYVRSGDSGKTWTQPKSIMDPDDSMKYSQDFASLAIDSSNRLYVTFLDNRELLRKTSTNYQLYLLRSFDGGNSWSKAFRATNMPNGVGGTCECCKQEIVASPQGHLYAAFRSNINNVRDIYIARSLDQGTTWETAIKAQSGIWTIGACPTTGPNILLDRDENLHVVWKDSRDAIKRSIAYYTLLPKGSLRVLPNIAISRRTGQSANWPSVSLGNDGLLIATFQISASSGQQLRYTVSSDGGSTWSVDTTITATNDDQQLADLQHSQDGKYYLAWMNSPSSGGSDLLLSSVSSMPQPLQPKAVTVVSPLDSSLKPLVAGILAWRKPFSSVIWFDAKISGGAIADSTLATIDTSWQMPALPSGSYRYTVTAHTTTGAITTTGNFAIAKAGVSVNGVALGSPRLYPNPMTADNPSLMLDRGEFPATAITITDALGWTVYEEALSAGLAAVSRIPVHNLRPGSYNATIAGRGQEVRTVFIVR